MEKHLFLIGPSGCGKSTMIRRALGGALAYAGGFVTERVNAPDGKLIGYDMTSAAAAAGIEGFERERFLDCSGPSPVTDNEVFRGMGVRLLNEAQYYPYALMDEFGGFELIIPQFREELLEVLNNDSLPCIGVLKSLKDGEAMRQRLGLGTKYSMYLEKLTAALRAAPDTLLLETSGRYDKKAEETVARWVEEYAR